MVNRVRELRKRRDWTQEDLAAAAGISSVQVSRIERGVSGWSDKSLSKIAEALKVRRADLMSDAADMPEAEDIIGLLSGMDRSGRQQAVRVVQALAAQDGYRLPEPGARQAAARHLSEAPPPPLRPKRGR